MPVTRAVLVAELDRLDPPELADFVADLWRVRGWSVERVDETRLRVTRDGDSRTVAVGAPAEAERVDEVVALDGDAGRDGVTVVDGTALHGQALYAIGRDDLAALVERHLGRSLAGLEADGETEGAGVDAEPGATEAGAATGRETVDDPTDHRRRWRAAGRVAVVVAVLVAVALGAAVVLGGAGSDAGTAPSTPTQSTDGSRTAGADGRPGLWVGVPNGTGNGRSIPATGSSCGVGTDAPLPPGLSASGAVDADRLRSAHASALANRSYRLTLTYREYVDGRPTAARREVVRVANATTYAASVRRTGRFRTTPASVARGDVYADGTTRYRPDGTGGTPVDPTERPFLDETSRYLGYYLSVRTTCLAATTTVDGRPAYWVTVDGDPWPGVANTTGSALVDSRGVVRYLRRSYDVPETDGTSVTVTLRVDGVGSTTVAPPAWHATATGNRTSE